MNMQHLPRATRIAPECLWITQSLMLQKHLISDFQWGRRQIVTGKQGVQFLCRYLRSILLTMKMTLICNRRGQS